MSDQNTEFQINKETAEADPLILNLDNWVNERRVLGEKLARKTIRDAVKLDLERAKLGGLPAPLEVLKKAGKDIKRIEELPTDIQTEPRSDSQVPDERFFTRVRKTEQGWVAEEVNENGVFTQAEIYHDGRTSLTLRGASSRYDQLGANPNILNRTDLPNATLTTFHILTGVALGWEPTMSELISAVQSRLKLNK